MRLQGWKLPIERMSATSLALAIQCPEQFRQKYLLKPEVERSGDAFVGSVFHESVRSLFVKADDGVDAAIERCWQESLDKEGEPNWREDDPVEMYKRTRLMLKTYAPISEKIQAIEFEKRFEDEIAGVPIVGYIDRELDDRILEVKTTGQKTTKPKAHHRFQGKLYSLVSDKPVEWHYVTKQATPKVYGGVFVEGLTSVEPDLFMPRENPDLVVMVVERAVARLNDYYARYGKDEPWPTDGTFHDWLCSYCSYKRFCPAWRS